MSNIVPPFASTPSWLAQGQFYVFLHSRNHSHRVSIISEDVNVGIVRTGEEGDAVCIVIQQVDD